MENKIEKAKENEDNIVPQKSEDKNSSKSLLEKTAKDIMAIFFWLYVLIKLFIFDFDSFLIERYFPEEAWILNFKFFILIGICAAILVFTKNKKILIWLSYILFFPIIVLLWKIPYFVVKQQSWIFAIAFIDAVLSFFKSFKFNFITSAIFLISLVIILVLSNQNLLWVASILLLITLSVIYAQRFILVFKPTSIYQAYMKGFSGIQKNKYSTLALDNEIKSIPFENLDEKQLEKWTNNLQNSVLYNRIYLFSAKKLRNYQNSGLNFVFYLFSILLLVFLTIITFAAINFGLYKINNQLFEISSTPSFFSFFYYSFNNLWSKSIPEITPIMSVSQAVSMMELVFAFFLVVIFVSLIISSKSKRHSEELNEVIQRIEREGYSIEEFIKNEFNVDTIDDARQMLEKLKANFVGFIDKISENIK